METANFMEMLTNLNIFIRCDIKRDMNIELLEMIIPYLDIESNEKLNFSSLKEKLILKKELIPYENLICFKNTTETDNQEEIDKYLPILKKVNEKIIDLINKRDFKKAYDLVDAFHFLPEVLIKKGKLRELDFWEMYIHTYRTMHKDFDFLKNEESKIFQTNDFAQENEKVPEKAKLIHRIFKRKNS